MVFGIHHRDVSSGALTSHRYNLYKLRCESESAPRFFCSSLPFSIIFLLLSYVACDTPTLFGISKDDPTLLLRSP